MSDLAMGLVNIKPQYIFIGEGEGEDTNYLWYAFDHTKEKAIPIYEDSLVGYLEEVHLFVKKFKGKFSTKIRIKVGTPNRVFYLQSGVTTLFTRKVVLALSKLSKKELAQPIAIQPQQAMEDKVVFANLFQRGEKGFQIIKVEWDADKQLLPLIQEIQKNLGQEVQTAQQLKEMEENYGK